MIQSKPARIASAAARPERRVDGADLAEPVRDLGDGAQVVEADAARKLGLAREHVAVTGDLHDVDAVLDLAARLRDHLLARVAEHGKR